MFDTRFLFTFFVWTVHRSWFLFENMAKNLGLIEATLKKKLSRRSSPKLRFPLLHSLWTAFFFYVRTGHYLEDGAFTRFASRDKLQLGWEFDFCLFQSAILECVIDFDDINFIWIVRWIK